MLANSSGLWLYPAKARKRILTNSFLYEALRNISFFISLLGSIKLEMMHVNVWQQDKVKFEFETDKSWVW